MSATDTRPRVGYIGLGLMGQPMARNVLRKGFPLTVYNRTRSKTAGLEAEGATVAPSIAALAAGVEVVCTCVTGPRDVVEVYLGESGVLSGAREGTLLIDMSTIDPQTQQTVSRAAAGRGCAYLDAPVSGGVGGATAGTLAIMCGGDAATFERARPVLEAMGQHLYHCGPAGAGATAKLINNLISACTAAAASEAMVLGAKAGLDLAQLHDLLMDASAGSKALGSMRQGALVGNFEPGFTIDNMQKDVTLAGGLARELGVRLLTGAITEQVLREAQLRGLGARGTAAQILPMEDLAGVKVRVQG
ncbi:MAG TPA: NAD(P)-dependent oxidoreductase [Chloroflexota bacterium]|nr:NAD(P)-dependent oxidoreductase [Chloroflexota bacterium]